MRVYTGPTQASRTAPRVRHIMLCLAMAAAFPVARANKDLTALSLEQLMGLRIVGASRYEQKQSEVAAAPRVMDQGVMLNMAVAQGRVTFEANLVAARRSRLNLSSKLLHLATEVVQ